MNWRDNLPKGHMGFGGPGWWMASCLLLLIAEKPSYGYELASRLKKFGIIFPGIGHMGSLYRSLSFLELSGFIIPEWDTSISPPRKIYKLTPLGRKYLNDIAQIMKNLKISVDKFLEIYDNLEKEKI